MSESDVMDVFVRLGEKIGDFFKKNRPITLVRRGEMSESRWKAAPQKLANGLYFSPLVHFSPQHPDLIVIVSQGGLTPPRTTKAHIRRAIGKGAEVKYVNGEEHPEIPFNVDVVAVVDTLVYPNVSG